MNATCQSQAGFSLIELLVASVIMITVTAGVLAVLHPSHSSSRIQPEIADMQQRLRVGVDALGHDLLMAGAGVYSGVQSGSLVGYFAPVLPFRLGSSATYDDGPGVFTSNALTVLYVPSTAPQATISNPMSEAEYVAVNAESGCPAGDPLCGFKSGKHVVVYDLSGAFDTFSVTDVGAGGTLSLRHGQLGELAKVYPARSKIAEVVQRTYFIDTADAQLMVYDGLSAPDVVLDNVVRLNFEYYGEPNPPVFRKPGVDRSVTYGPEPPALDVTQSPWPAGENCTWLTSGGDQVTRLATLTGGSGGAGLVKLTAAQLTDGPWCPDSTSGHRYDADLLRIRRVRVTIRLQTGNAALRGPAGGSEALFVNPGTAKSAALTVADQSITFDVSPRNMNLGR
jgi:prepilin-type N-terminal cleavage/methylation domain-containing protein